MKNVFISNGDPKRSRNLTWFIGYGGLSIAFIATSLILYWLSSPLDALVIKNNPVFVEPKEVEEKQPLFVTVDFCKKSKAYGIVKVYIVTQFREIPLPVYTDRLPKLCEKVTYPVLMQEMLRSSSAHLRWEIEYKLNPLRTVKIDFISQPFTIIATDE